MKYRARMVAEGFSQKPGIDFDETFSPVVKHSTLRLLFAFSAKLDLNVFHLNLATAFLNWYLKENVFMTFSPSAKRKKKAKNKVLKLKKAIYGLKQSARSCDM
ncbi:hypothetical protein AMK59_806 [Oryctes borbonicus]|uniref:Reverse transcriptase Ty1/copia-type domain-containing protein n=1 Tax=Oryctes borbonicus TaxID=1629725 RepID=A0A0T6BHQ7_9SCAR|nr:hypothetical protein AMK59_806 [Oryctes borbonicus]